MFRLNRLVFVSALCGAALTATAQQPLLTGQAAFTAYAHQQPGVRHKIPLADLPAPDPAEAVDNGPTVVSKPADAWPTAPAGFKVTLYAGGDSTPMQRSESRRATHHAAEGTFGDIIRLLLLTAQRVGKVGTMKWADGKDGVWTMPREPREKVR